MLSVFQHDRGLEVEFSAEPSKAAIALASCAAHLERAGYPVRGDMDLALREMLANAVAHGCGNDPARTVVLELVREEEGRVLARVADNGPGFDHAAALARLREDPFGPGGRGLTLISAFSRDLSFNEAGNEVTARFVLPHARVVVLREERDCLVEVRADPTGETARELWEALAPLASGTRPVVLDLGGVREIDAAGLGVLAAFAQTLERKGAARPALRNPCPELADFLRQCGLAARYDLAGTPEGEA